MVSTVTSTLEKQLDQEVTMSTTTTISASDIGRDTLVELAENTKADSGVRLRAAEVLKSHGEPVGSTTLIALAQDTDVDSGVRLRAAEVLAA